MEDIILERSINFLGLTTIIGTFEGFLIGCFLLLYKSIKRPANTYLGILILIITLYIFPGFVFRTGYLVAYPHVVHIHIVTILLTGPFAYFYICACIQKDFQLKPIHSLHFLPAVAALCYHIPFYLQSGPEKVEIFLNFLRHGDLGISPVIGAAKVFHVVLYFCICVRLVLVYRRHLSNTASYIDTDFHRWLLLFCFILLLPILTLFIFILTGYRFTNSPLLLSGFFFFIIGVHLVFLAKPTLFHTFPHQMLLPKSTEKRKQKYEKSTLQANQKEKMLDKLLTFVETEKPYLTPELTLAQLAKQIDMPTHLLSQIINEKLDCNFLDFINGYRIKAAQAKLKDKAFSNYTIVSIAHEVGFNSKSPFYTAFKKHTDTTPSKYRKLSLQQRTVGDFKQIIQYQRVRKKPE